MVWKFMTPKERLDVERNAGTAMVGAGLLNGAFGGLGVVLGARSTLALEATCHSAPQIHVTHLCSSLFTVFSRTYPAIAFGVGTFRISFA